MKNQMEILQVMMTTNIIDFERVNGEYIWDYKIRRDISDGTFGRVLKVAIFLYLPADHSIKIIDLGGAEFDDENHNWIINTQQYRAPEVQFQCCGWDQKNDMWGIASIIFEMSKDSNELKNEFEHMALVVKITEQSFPHWMASNVKGNLKHCFNIKNEQLQMKVQQRLRISRLQGKQYWTPYLRIYQQRCQKQILIKELVVFKP